MGGLFLQHRVVALGQPHQLPAAEVGDQPGERQREQQKQADHPPRGAVGIVVALEAQRLLGVDEGGEFRAHVVGQPLAAAQPYLRLRVLAGAARGDQAAREFDPGALDGGDAVQALDLLPVVRHQLAQRGRVGLHAGQGALVGFQESLVTGDQEAAHAGLHVDALALQLAGGAGHAVGVLDPADGVEQKQDQPDEHHGAENAADQRELEVAAQQTVEVFRVDRGGSVHRSHL